MDPEVFAPDRILTDDEMRSIRDLIQIDVKNGLPGTEWFYIAETLKLPHTSVQRYGDGIDGGHLTLDADQIPPEVFAPDRTLTDEEMRSIRELIQIDVKDGLPGTEWFYIAETLKLPHASVQRYGDGINGNRIPSDDEGDHTIEILLDHQRTQVSRKVAASSSNMHIYHLAIEYLLEMFQTVVANPADILLTCDGQKIPISGLISEIPLEVKHWEYVVKITLRSNGNRTPDPQTPNRVPSPVTDTTTVPTVTQPGEPV
jgi:hypothetical protein